MDPSLLDIIYKFLVGIAKRWDTILGILSLLGITIEIIPQIKVNPIKWLLGWIGTSMNKDVKSDITSLSVEVNSIKSDLDNFRKQTELDKIESKKWEIMSFARSLQCGNAHSRSEFERIIHVYQEYESLTIKNGVSNGVVDSEMKYILEMYGENKRNGGFLVY